MPEQLIDIHDCLIVTEDPTLELYSARSVETSRRALTRGSCFMQVSVSARGNFADCRMRLALCRSSSLISQLHAPRASIFSSINLSSLSSTFSTSLPFQTTNVSVYINERLLSYCDGVTVCLFACLICLLAVTSSLQVCHDARQGRSGL